MMQQEAAAAAPLHVSQSVATNPAYAITTENLQHIMDPQQGCNGMLRSPI